MSWTEEIIFELKTPVGSFSVLDGNSRIGFFAWPDDDDYELLDDQHHTRGIIHVTRYEITVPASSLELGKRYVFCFSDGNWEFCDSDEGTDCYVTHIGDWFVGIGAMDWNHYEKWRQQIQYRKEKGIDEWQLGRDWTEGKFQYDKSLLVNYDIEFLGKMNGYQFELLPNTKYVQFKDVSFQVGWVKAEEFSEYHYWEALGVDLC